LRLARFRPRASFGAELMGRVRRGESPAGPVRSRIRGRVLIAAAALLVLTGIHFSKQDPERLDRCCYDLDGGGVADDGVLIVSTRGGRTQGISVYEDVDGSLSFTPGDPLRFEREGSAAAEQEFPEGYRIIRQCCQDFDGGGPADDAIFVVAVPPDQVHAAAIYELR